MLAKLTQNRGKLCTKKQMTFQQYFIASSQSADLLMTQTGSYSLLGKKGNKYLFCLGFT